MAKKELLEYIEKNSKKRDKNLKYDFMPSLLEIIERPAHVAGSVIIWSIFILFAFVLLWATFSKTEVVVTSLGSVTPEKDEQIISAATTYKKIDEIFVENGQEVKFGETLIKFNTEDLEREKEEITEELDRALEIISLYDKIINDTDISQISANDYCVENRSIVRSILANYQSNQLFNSESYKDDIMAEQEEYKAKGAEISEEIEKISENISKANVISMYDGIVYNLYISKEDNGVYEGQPVISILEKGTEYEMECYFSDSQIGDLKLNQRVNIKLNAYPYNEYGTVDGYVTYISNKVEAKENVGAKVLVKVKIDDKNFKGEIIPGLTGNVDIVIGKRRIISYFIDPIIGAMDKSMKEK